MGSSITVEVRGGGRICVPASLELITPYVLLEQEDWFEDEIRFVRRFLRPGMRAVDVGASFGVYTMTMARSVGAEGSVWAFEPTPGTADFLGATLELNQASQVRLTRAALSDRPGSVAFRTGEQSELNAVAQPGEPGTVSVPAVTLDQMAAEQSWGEVDFIKLDVEGHEVEVITGGTALFNSASPLVMFEIKGREGVDLRPLALLGGMGYRFYRLLPDPPLLVPFDQHASLDAFQLNLFACKPDRGRLLAAQRLLAESTSVPPKVAGGAWSNYLRAAPYARQVARGWPEKAGWFAAADLRAYLEGLALYAQSRDPGVDAAVRIMLIEQARQRVSEATARKDTLPRCVTSARLDWELGQRDEAVKALRRAGERIVAEGHKLVGEPYLAPSPRYEQMSIDAPVEDWLACAVAPAGFYFDIALRSCRIW